MAEFTVTVLGSGSAVFMHGRYPSGQVVRYGQDHILIDCGEGTQWRLREFGIKSFRIQTILISHLHGDHIYGLPGLLSSYCHLGRKDPLTIYGPSNTQLFLRTLIDVSALHLTFPLHIVEATPSGPELLEIRGNLSISTFPLRHRIPTNGYLLREIVPATHLDKAMLTKYAPGVEQIQAILRGEAIKVGGQRIEASSFYTAPESILSYGYCSDTGYDHRMASMVKGVTLLYHETTFDQSLDSLARQTGHSTAGEAGQVAADAGALYLLAGHFSSRYADVEVLKREAELYFPNVIMAKEGDIYDIRSMASGTYPHERQGSGPDNR